MKKRTFRRVSLCALLAFGVLLSGAWVSADIAVRKIVQAKLPALLARADSAGLQISHLRMAETGLALPFAFECQDVHGSVEVTRPVVPTKESYFDFSVERVSATPRLPGFGSVTLLVEGASLTPVRELGKPVSSTSESKLLEIVGIKLQSFSSDLAFNLGEPLQAVQQSLLELEQIARTGRSNTPFHLIAFAQLKLGGREQKLLLSSDKDQSGYFLRSDTQSLRALAAFHDLKISEEELEVVASYPLQAPELMRIKELAENTAIQLHRQDQSIPRDAYKHVLWSYQLAKSLGEEVAEKITSAHERGSDDNSPGELLMDMNNNELGLEYARKGIAEGGLLEVALSDPRLIREPELL